MPQQKEVNYKALFLAGITFMGAGVALTAAIGIGVGAGLIGVGVMMMVIGAKNRDKWEK